MGCFTICLGTLHAVQVDMERMRVFRLVLGQLQVPWRGIPRLGCEEVWVLIASLAEATAGFVPDYARAQLTNCTQRMKKAEMMSVRNDAR